jgi:hypothetical protein
MNPLNNVYVRLAIYMLSLLIGAIPAAWAGWLMAELVNGWLHIHIQIEGAMTALATATGISGGVYKLWGTR